MICDVISSACASARALRYEECYFLNFHWIQILFQIEQGYRVYYWTEWVENFYKYSWNMRIGPFAIMSSLRLTLFELLIPENDQFSEFSKFWNVPQPLVIIQSSLYLVHICFSVHWSRFWGQFLFFRNFGAPKRGVKGQILKFKKFGSVTTENLIRQIYSQNLVRISSVVFSELWSEIRKNFSKSMKIPIFKLSQF